MNAYEVRTAMKNLRDRIGANAHMSMSITVGWGGSDEKPLTLRIYPEGIANSSQDTTFQVEGSEAADLIQRASEEWERRKDAVQFSRLKEMALKIIELTYANGECTDAALRASFDSQFVREQGTAAAELASSMGLKGPFTIVETGKANGAPDAEFVIYEFNDANAYFATREKIGYVDGIDAAARFNRTEAEAIVKGNEHRFRREVAPVVEPEF